VVVTLGPEKPDSVMEKLGIRRHGEKLAEDQF
jgi:hypothetical protein